MDTDLYRTIEVRSSGDGVGLRAWKKSEPKINDDPFLSLTGREPFFDTAAAACFDRGVDQYHVFRGVFRIIETPGHVLVVDASDE